MAYWNSAIWLDSYSIDHAADNHVLKITDSDLNHGSSNF